MKKKNNKAQNQVLKLVAFIIFPSILIGAIFSLLNLSKSKELTLDLETYNLESQQILFSEDLDSFRQDQWETVTTGGYISSSTSVEGINPYSSSKLLVLNYNKPTYGHILLENSSLISKEYTNVSYSGYFYDPGPDIRRGFQFRVSSKDQSQEFLVGANSRQIATNYYLRPGKSDKPFFDTKIPRTKGWHKVEIRITQVGTYALIDDKNMSYLPAVNNQIPVNTNFTRLGKFGLAVTWEKTIGNYLFDKLEINKLPDSFDQAKLYKDSVSALLNNFKQENTLLKYTTIKKDPASGRNIYYFDSSKVYIAPISASNTTRASIDRIMANYTLAKIFDCKYNQNLSNACLDESITLIHSLLKSENFNAWKGTRDRSTGLPTSTSFLYPNSPLTSYPLLLGSWLIWDKIPNTTEFPLRNLLVSRLKSESDFWASHSPTNLRIKNAKVGDSNAEELAWTSAYLILSGNIFDNSTWLNSGINMANEALMAKNSGDFNTNSYKLYNHNMLHPGYAIYSLASISEGILSYKLLGKNYANVINSINLNNFVNANLDNSINFNSFRYKENIFNENLQLSDDWSRSPDLNPNSTFAFLSKINTNDYSNKYNKLIGYRYYTDQNNFIPYNIPTSQVSKASGVTYIIEDDPNRALIESIQGLYDIVSYLWQDNTKLNKVN